MKQKFKVYWHDADDDRSGAPFFVEASSPCEACLIADNQIRITVKRYVPTDIELLEDEEGVRHNPDILLDEMHGKRDGK